MKHIWKQFLTAMLAITLIITSAPVWQIFAADESTDETLTKAEYLLNYLVVEKPHIKTPDTQSIVVSIGENDCTYQNAVLIYQNQETGEIYEAAADRAEGNTSVFEIKHEQEEAVYALTEIRFEADGQERKIILADCGLEVQYGVNKEIETSSAAASIVEDIDESNLHITVTDADGNAVSEDTFADTLEKAASEIPSVFSEAQSVSNNNLVVVIDPGHDARHAGADYFGVNEQKLTLKIAQYCKAELDTYDNVEVYLTRETEACAWGSVTSEICLNNRSAFAKEKGADVFVSIHLNADGTGKAKGASVYYPTPNYRPDLSEEGAGLAQEILDKLGELGITKRGIEYLYVEDNDPKYNLPDGSRGDKYAVIRKCKEYGIPGLIVEHVFLSNASDYNEFLNTDDKLQNLGIADATAIAEYYELERTGTPVTVYQGVDYAPVYNYDYYIDRYPELKQEIGEDTRAVLKYFVTSGMNEGHQAIETFDVQSYRNQYVDLRRAFGSNLKSYYMHYITNGKREGRKAVGCTKLQNPVTVYKGTDYKDVYNYQYYLDTCSDVKKYAGNDSAMLEHFVTVGMQEGRQGCETFDVLSYKNRYPDLRRVLGKNVKAYYTHYITNGKKEGRTAVGCKTVVGALTVYNGIDYKAVYDYNYYTEEYTDMQQGAGYDEAEILRHFVTVGMREGRQGCENFDVQSYKNQYPDLRRAFGKNLNSYYMHYITNGKKEGRIAVGCTTVAGAATVYNGVDYKAVYDFNYYTGTYSDLKRAFGYDDEAALRHFVMNGMREGRQGNSSFNVRNYKNKYPDLQRAFGNNWESYYKHYLTYGIREGRTSN